jgi:hypothetical protein
MGLKKVKEISLFGKIIGLILVTTVLIGGVVYGVSSIMVSRGRRKYKKWPASCRSM